MNPTNYTSNEFHHNLTCLFRGINCYVQDGHLEGDDDAVRRALVEWVMCEAPTEQFGAALGYVYHDQEDDYYREWTVQIGDEVVAIRAEELMKECVAGVVPVRLDPVDEVSHEMIEWSRAASATVEGL